jgi:hypothetical protein
MSLSYLFIISGKICGFEPGHPLQQSIWEYQPSHVTNGNIRNGITESFKGWKQKTQDKFYHLFFFFV